MLEGASSVDGAMYFELIGTAHDRFCVRRPRPQPSRDRVNLLFDITSRMACLRDISFKCKTYKPPSLAHRRHRQ